MEEVANELSTENENNTAEREEYRQTKLGWIPKVWDVILLREIAEVQGGYAFKSSRFLSTGKYQVIKMSNLYNGTLDLKRSESFLDEIGDSESDFLINENDILLTLTGTVGKRDYGHTIRIGKADNLLLNQRVGRIIVNRNSQVDPTFIFYVTKTERFLNQFFFSARGGTGNQANVGIQDVAGLFIPLPPLPEQQKIARILSTWDQAIEKTQQLIAAKEKRKKGLMQQLLTGKKRLPGFSGEWEEHKVEDIFTFIKSIPLSRAHLTYEGSKGNVYYLHYGDIHALFKGDVLKISTETKIPFLKKESESTNLQFLQNGDIVIADASEDYEGVGEAIEIADVNEHLVVAGLHTIVLRDRANVASPYFCGYLFNSEVVLSLLRRVATGISVYGISKSNLATVRIILPSKAEQSAIVRIVRAANTEMDLLKHNLENLKNQKKGLMQKLLTGQIRVQESKQDLKD